MSEIIHHFFHLDAFLSQQASALGPWLYVLVFAILFCETGLVVMAILPGDSLLFALGALCALPASGLSIGLMTVLCIVAAILGDATNYAIGKKLGPAVFRSESSWLLNRKHLLHTQKFYEKHGGKTIVLARFMPIVRTFAPFVAGIGHMSYRRFAVFNVTGALAWVIGFLGLGYAFGNLEVVKKRFHIVIVGIIIVSVLPAVIEFWRARRAGSTPASIG